MTQTPTSTPGCATHTRGWFGHGDLLLMQGESQSSYQHSVPKRARAEARINLTFRRFGGAL